MSNFNSVGYFDFEESEHIMIGQKVTEKSLKSTVWHALHFEDDINDSAV